MGYARIGLWEWERLWSHINKKELQICFIALEYFVLHLRDIHVQLSVDNTAAVSYLNHAGGTRSQAWSDLATAIRNVVYIPGIVNKIPDGLSRQKLESTEWILDSNVFSHIVAVYQQPQVEKKINLAVWPVSGNPLKSKGFLKGCPEYCFPQGDPVQRNIISQHGNHLIAGVLKNRKI